MRSEESNQTVTWLVRSLAAIVCLVLMAVIWLPSQWAIKNRPWYDYLYPVTLWGSMLFFSIWAGMSKRSRSERRFIAIVLVLFLVSRIAWVLLVPTQPFSDFEEYNKWASIFGQFQPIDGDMYRLSINLAMQPWLYPISLAVLYDIFGQHLIVAELFNVVVGAITLLLVYLLARRLFDSNVARLSAILLLFWPTQLMYTSVLGSEHLALVFALSAFVFLAPVLRHDKESYRKVIIAGLFLGLSFVTRYAVILALPCFIFAIALTRQSFKLKAAHATLLLAAFVLTFGVYLGATALIWRQVQLPAGGLQLLEGTNFASGGTYTNEDTVLYQSHATMAEANQFARAEALRRIRSNPSAFVRLMGDKIVVYWRDDSDGAYFSTQHMYPEKASAFVAANQRSLFAVSQFFHLSLLILAVFSCLLLIFRGGGAHLVMIMLYILSGTLMHSIVVVHSRLHYPAEPLIIILAAFAVISLTSQVVKFNPGSLRHRLAESYTRLRPLSMNVSLTAEGHSPHSKRIRWRTISLLVLAGIVLLLISIMTLSGRLRMDHRNGEQAPASQSAQPATNQTKAAITASPNPVKVCDGSGLGITTVSYAFPPGRLVEVHVGSPDGQLFARPAAPGSSATAKWVADGMAFFLQDVTDGKPPSQDNTLATVTARVSTEGCQ